MTIPGAAAPVTKSSVDEIRARFDADVDRFSNLETGQNATMDAPMVLDMIAHAAELHGANATAMLDIGCGAGNWTIKLMPRLPKLHEVVLVDLSKPMLDRAAERIAERRAEELPASAPRPTVTTIQGDIRNIHIGEGRFDIVVAAAVLHHLRGDDEWLAVFGKIYEAMKPGGAFFISDLLDASVPAVAEVMRARYAAYLAKLGGSEYVNKVLDYIAREDSPRPLLWQIDKLREAGFHEVDILHKNGPFAAFVGIK